MGQWLQHLVEGLRDKLREWRDVLDTPILPDPELVPIPVKPRRPGRPR